MKKVILLFTIALLASCAHHGDKRKPSSTYSDCGNMLIEATTETLSSLRTKRIPPRSALRIFKMQELAVTSCQGVPANRDNCTKTKRELKTSKKIMNGYNLGEHYLKMYNQSHDIASNTIQTYCN